MKRFAFKLILFVLLGAILNVAVAWAYSIWISPDRTNYGAAAWTQGEREHLARVFRRAGFCGVWSCDNGPASRSARVRFGMHSDNDIDQSAVPEWCFGLAPTAIPEIPQLWCAEDYASGWPTLSMRSRFISDRKWFLPTDVVISRGCIPLATTTLANGEIRRRALPITPIWPGFAINTIFYAAILWLPFAALGTLHRRRRIKRGLCAWCGYPVSASGSAVCSECGTAVHGAAAPCNPCEQE